MSQRSYYEDPGGIGVQTPSPAQLKRHARKLQLARRALPHGPWTYELDRLEWVHAGIVCLILRNEDGFNLCGYVAVPQGHPWYEKDGEAVDLEGADPHGGITFAGFAGGSIFATNAPYPALWWIGFDCAHYGDYRPGEVGDRRRRDTRHFVTGFTEYRTIGFVKAECEMLADQIIKREDNGGR